MAAWSTIQLCTIADIEREMRALPTFGRISENQGLVLEKIALVKEWIANVLRARFRILYPTTVAEVSRYGQYLYDETIARLGMLYENADPSRIALDAYEGSPGTLPLFVDGFTSLHLPPRVYYYAGAPADGLYNGDAGNGSFLCDITNAAVYINRGTKEATLWRAFDVDALLDNIKNPQELKHAAVAGVLWALMEDSAMGFQSDYGTANDVINNSIPKRKKVYEQRLEDAIKLLEIDISGDNVISEFERTRTQGTANEWFA